MLADRPGSTTHRRLSLDADDAVMIRDRIVALSAEEKTVLTIAGTVRNLRLLASGRVVRVHSSTVGAAQCLLVRCTREQIPVGALLRAFEKADDAEDDEEPSA